MIKYCPACKKETSFAMVDYDKVRTSDHTYVSNCISTLWHCNYCGVVVFVDEEPKDGREPIR